MRDRLRGWIIHGELGLMATRRNPTIKDIAQLADVSTTTVSHVLNRTRPVSQALSNRVLDAVRELEYRPNAIARGLRTQSSQILGLVIPDNTNPFFSEMTLGAEEAAFRFGYSVLLGNSRHDLARELTYLSTLSSYPVDGLILTGVSVNNEHVLSVTESGIPVVIVDRRIDGVAADLILSDHYSGAYNAAAHLIGLGHRNIAIITGPMDLQVSKDRLNGFLVALDEAGVKPDPERIIEGDFQLGSGYEAARRILAMDPVPTGVFASNDLMAIGAMRQFNEHRIKIPEQISIVGFDNTYLSTYVYPPLTTVAQPAHKLGSLAVERLIGWIENPGDMEIEEFCLQTELIVRQTTQGVE